eukprot:TRINITY_DN4539_c0_g1_i3.p1 TRINITY_DN4539_c0_g1~~TRINITY_DN4539_c0_g1_i3.p1  ORF type:complete len:502 (-),score=88.73 TRINITY_DN4539_c0_g1_i3:539-2044(-)
MKCCGSKDRKGIMEAEGQLGHLPGFTPPESSAWWTQSGAEKKCSESGTPYKRYLKRSLHPAFGKIQEQIERDMQRAEDLMASNAELMCATSGQPIPSGVDFERLIQSRLIVAGRVLGAFAVRNPQLGYAQEFGRSILGIVSVEKVEERSFWLLCTLLEDILPQDLCKPDALGLSGINQVGAVLQRLCVHRIGPELSQSCPPEFWPTAATKIIPTVMVGELPRQLLFKVLDRTFCRPEKNQSRVTQMAPELSPGFTFLMGAAVTLLHRFFSQYESNECWDFFKYLKRVPMHENDEIIAEAQAFSHADLTSCIEQVQESRALLWAQSTDTIALDLEWSCWSLPGPAGVMHTEQISAAHKQYLALPPQSAYGIPQHQFVALMEHALGVVSPWAVVAAPRIFQLVQRKEAVGFAELMLVLCTLCYGTAEDVALLVFQCYTLGAGCMAAIDEQGKNAFVAALVLAKRAAIFEGVSFKVVEAENELVRQLELAFDEMFLRCAPSLFG